VIWSGVSAGVRDRIVYHIIFDVVSALCRRSGTQVKVSLNPISAMCLFLQTMYLVLCVVCLFIYCLFRLIPTLMCFYNGLSASQTRLGSTY